MPTIKNIYFVPSIKIFYYSYKNIALFITAIKRFMPAKKKNFRCTVNNSNDNWQISIYIIVGSVSDIQQEKKYKINNEELVVV